MKRHIFDVVVVGGGLHGLSAALHLARAGMRVVVLERAWVGRHASGSTAAGVRTLNRDFGELELSLEAIKMWHDMPSLVGDDCGFHSDGQICIAEQPEQLLKLETRVSKLSAMGYTHESIIDWKELRKLVPAIGPRCAGASIATSDAADPHRTIGAFRLSALAAGAAIREGCSVERIERRGDDWAVATQGLEINEFVAPFVVNAAGAWGGRVAAMVGDVIPLGTKASMMIASERLAPMIRPVVSLAGRSLSFKQSDQGTLVIGGGLQGVADLDTESSVVRLGVLSKGARAATDLFPCVRDVRMVRIWAGLEANTSDGLPVIGPAVNAPGVFHTFGYSGHGFQLVPVVGATIADLVKTGSTRRAIGALAPQRLMPLPIPGAVSCA